MRKFRLVLVATAVAAGAAATPATAHEGTHNLVFSSFGIDYAFQVAYTCATEGQVNVSGDGHYLSEPHVIDGTLNTVTDTFALALDNYFGQEVWGTMDSAADSGTINFTGVIFYSQPEEGEPVVGSFSGVPDCAPSKNHGEAIGNAIDGGVRATQLADIASKGRVAR